MNSRNDKDKLNKSRFVTVLENILEEDPDSIAEVRSEKTEPEMEASSGHSKDHVKLKRRIYVIFGILLTFFAVIGIIAAGRYSLRYVSSFTSGEESKNDLTNVIYPAVIMDITEFRTVSELSSDQIISAALWSLVMSADDMEKYDAALDVISVPAVDVETYAAKLFGDNLPELNHGTVGSGELKFYYNSETKSYNVPVSPVSFTYVPDITSISKDGTDYTVVVDYIKEIPEWMERSKNFSPEVSKTVEFKLSESNDSYVILSMSVISVNNLK